MSDKKISELTPASALNLDDLLALVQDGETRRVSLRKLINELQLNIPQPRIKIRKDTDNSHFGHNQVIANWEGSDARFMKYNPEYWLYRYKRADLKSFVNKESGNREQVWRKRRFVHPSHQHGNKYAQVSGDGSKLFDGEQKIQIGGSSGLIPSRNTEWDVDAEPLGETILDLAPWTYFRVNGMDPFAGIAPDGFPLSSQPSPRGTGSNRSRMVVFKVRIAIDNPDEDPAYPKIFGPFSETFILYPLKFDNIWTHLSYFLGPEASPGLHKR